MGAPRSTWCAARPAPLPPLRTSAHRGAVSPPDSQHLHTRLSPPAGRRPGQLWPSAGCPWQPTVPRRFGCVRSVALLDSCPLLPPPDTLRARRLARRSQDGTPARCHAPALLLARRTRGGGTPRAGSPLSTWARLTPVAHACCTTAAWRKRPGAAWRGCERGLTQQRSHRRLLQGRPRQLSPQGRPQASPRRRAGERPHQRFLQGQRRGGRRQRGENSGCCCAHCPCRGCL